MRRSAGSAPASAFNQRGRTAQQQRQQPPGSRLLRKRNQSMLGEFWDVPPPKAAEKPGPVQTTMPMWSRVLGGRSQTKSSSAGARAEGRQPPRIAGQIPASPAAGCQLIDSSDSSAEIECIATPPPRQQRTRQKPRSSAQTQNTGAKERADATSASQSGNTAAAARFSAKPCAAEEVVLDEEDDVVEVTADRGEKGAKDDAEVVLVLHPRRAPNRNRVLETPRHTRKRRAEELFAPSSPLLLHASSPTIKRFNTQQSQAVVLVEATQGLAGDELLPSSPPAAADHFSGDTLVSSSACPPQQSGDNSVSVQTAADGCDSSLMAAIDSTEWVPETPRQLLPADPPLTLGLGLSSDPISDFCSPAASPSLELNPAYERFGDRCLLSTLGSDPIPKGAGSETAPFAHSEAGHGAETDTGADADACTNPSITQWYHSNLQRCQSDDYDDDDDASGGLELPFDNSYGDLSLEGDSEGESAACETESSANAAQQQTEDGYSSPLEGFWDLRAATQGSSNERDMYYNQFQPTARQLANRQRAAERRTSSSTGLAIQPASSLLPAAPAPAAARGGPRGRGQGAAASGSRGRSARPRPRRAAPVRGGRRPKRRRGSAIRPVSTSRTAQEALASSPATTAALAPFNHYAHDPFLDVEASLNWEGGGVSRFG